MAKLYSMEVYERMVTLANAPAPEPTGNKREDDLAMYRWRTRGTSCYARPGVGLWQAIGRMMGAMRRSWSRPDPRSFPYWSPGMTTVEYVRDFYRRNSLNATCNVDLYIDMKRLGQREAPYNEPEQETEPELEAA